MAQRERKLPSLDGLRAVSIALVLFAHCAGTPNAYPLSWLGYLGEVGVFGVKVFFVISGFLITSLLLREHERTGSISLKDFYIRRILRIFPAYYTFLLIVFVLSRAGWMDATQHDLIHAATFTANFSGMGWKLLHTWSLSAEEQFYLAWPLSLVILGTKLPFRVAAFLIVLPPLFCGYVIHGHMRLGEAISGLAAGCVLARVRPELVCRTGYQRVLRAGPTVWIGSALLLLMGSMHGYSIYELLAPLTSIGIAFLLDALLTYPQSVPGRFLNLRAVSYLGTLSYSIYLWQQIFLDQWGHHWFNVFPVNVMCALACALGSFYLIERPFLRLKIRFRRVASLPVGEPVKC